MSKEFIQRLTGDADDSVHWQLYHDSDKSDSGKKLARSFYSTYDNALPKLQQAQTKGCGVYVTINETDGSGRTSKNIVSARACFIDGDNQDLPDNGSWGIYPHIIVARNARYWHAYWLIEESTDFETWQRLQYSLALYYGVKDRLHDLPRVMRAPGFNHLKNPQSPEEYKIIYNNPAARCTLSDVAAAHVLSGNQQQELDSWLTAPKLRKNGEDIINDDDQSIAKFIQRISSISPEEGDYNNALYIASNYGRDYGLSPEVIIKQITKWWETSWPVPVEPATIKTVVENAYKYGLNNVGAETTAGKFKSAPPLTEQVGSEEDLRVVAEGVAMSDIKYGKNHTINARVFIQSHSEINRHYITVQEESYIFEGTHWRKLEPKELGQHVLMAMLDARPNMDTVNQTASAVKLLTTNYTINKTPSWINNPGKNPKNFIAFKNGILDVTHNEWMEHTHELYYTHCLDYDYQHNANCSNWINYLNNEVFNGDKQLIAVLQEWFGYQLVQSYEFQKIAVLVGAPRAGKGTVCGVIRHMAGAHNVGAPSLSGLAKDAKLASLQDKAIAVIGDAHKVSFNKRDEVLETLKMISGGDPITIDRKHISAITIKFPTRFTLCANKMPEFLDSSGALAGRLILIPFRNSYLGKEDPKRLEKLLVEAPGILNWALQGLRRLQSNGKFTESADSVEMMETLQEDLSPIKAFMIDCLTVTADPGDIIPVTALYNTYKRWCAVNDRNPMKSQSFRGDLLSCSYAIRHTRKSIDGGKPRVFTGVRVDNNFENIMPGKFPAIVEGLV